MAKQEESAISPQADFTQYELAAWAGIAEQSQDKAVYGTVLPGLGQFYDQFHMGERPLSADPFVAGGFLRASEEVRARGKIGDRDFLNALAVHGNVYQDAFGKVTVKDAIARAEAHGTEVPTKFKTIARNYETQTIGELEKASEKDSMAKKVYLGVQSMETGKMYGGIFGQIVRENVAAGLEKLTELNLGKKNSGSGPGAKKK